MVSDRREISKKVSVWPNLVYREIIAAMVAMLALGLVSMVVDAPLEGVADPSFSINPSKAPWYFLGLQELLVYFSPWVAGVAVPSAVLFALMAVPYLDIDPRTKNNQVFPWGRAVQIAFSVGFVFWISLTVIGVLLRGPNWAWTWPFNHAVVAEKAPVGDLSWIHPLSLFVFMVFALLWRRKQFDREIREFGIVRTALSYFTAGTMFLVTIKVVVHIGWDLFSKMGT